MLPRAVSRASASVVNQPHWKLWNAAQNGERLGTLILMSPMLMLRGISGRFMFFTAETARAGAADRPPCQKKKKITVFGQGTIILWVLLR